ncbi:uncharacterized protein N7506_012193 [Penicillium brevicompactum]|uniref:uncharacterized protein n=1 Tax=Penicillium brevicompactum TaxID=5074 RepID=UPI00253F906A|nr:uncharacterized protein N7506_012193 [Penicillium brevicompactum]KAJ5319489.1 hypothetical protein N7506_012193 [Penicillium brevicompactum]
MRCLYFLLSTALCSPIYRSEVKNIPEILAQLLDTTTSYTNTIQPREIFQLSARISDITTGKITPIQTINQGLSILSTLQNKTSLQKAIAVVSAGLVPQNILTLLNPSNPINSYTNTNPPPNTPLYPKSPQDAPYDIPEPNLLAALYIPPHSPAPRPPSSSSPAPRIQQEQPSPSATANSYKPTPRPQSGSTSPTSPYPISKITHSTSHTP